MNFLSRIFNRKPESGETTPYTVNGTIIVEADGRRLEISDDYASAVDIGPIPPSHERGDPPTDQRFYAPEIRSMNNL